MIDVFKNQRTSANIKDIADTLTKYVNNNVITEEELKKVVELVHDRPKLTQLIKLL